MDEPETLGQVHSPVARVSPRFTVLVSMGHTTMPDLQIAWCK